MLLSTLSLGLRLDAGSWNTVAMLRRTALSSLPCSFDISCPFISTLPSVAGAKEICFTENPPVLTVSHDHTFSCHFAEEASKL